MNLEIKKPSEQITESNKLVVNERLHVRKKIKSHDSKNISK